MGDWDDSVKIYIRENAQDLITWLWKGAQVRRHLQTEFKVRTIDADSMLEIELENDGRGMLFHIEVQSTRDLTIAQRLLQYSVAANHQHGLPVYSCVIYLRDVGEAPKSPLRWHRLDGQEILRFDYLSIELAKIPIEELRATALVGLKPLFVLAKGGATHSVLEEVATELGEAQQFGLLSMSKMFADLVFRDEDQDWIERIFAMYTDPLAETRTYQKLVNQGVLQGLQEAFLSVVDVRFPTLRELAREKVTQATKPDAINLVLKGIAAAPDENAARILIELLAA